MLLPTEDEHSQMRSQLSAQLTMMMGVRAAEEIIFKHYTTGASNDLERATNIAHKMVCNWGMSEKVGPVYLAANQGEVFLGKDLMQRKRIGQKSASLIDKEVNRIVNDAYEKAVALLNKHRDALQKVTEKLLVEETISGDYVLETLKTVPA
jgi:cell division protease FtsH